MSREVSKTKKIKSYLNLARRVSLQSGHDTFKHGAVLVKGGSVINTSPNKGNHTKFGNRFRNKHHGPATWHAELACILGIDKSITQGATLYVCRTNREGNFRMSKPCAMCEEVLRYCGLKKVVYTEGAERISKIKL